jgi:pro-sigmaK processing inhibitor BofA
MTGFLDQINSLAPAIKIIALFAAAVVLILLIRIGIKPAVWLAKAVLGTALGFCALVVINFFGKFIGINLPVNIFSSAVLGLLSLPGLAVLFIMDIFI